jgi:hypothetical protein
MSAKTTTSEYLLLFRNTARQKGLSPEEMQTPLGRAPSKVARLIQRREAPSEKVTQILDI